MSPNKNYIVKHRVIVVNGYILLAKIDFVLLEKRHQVRLVIIYAYIEVNTEIYK